MKEIDDSSACRRTISTSIKCTGRILVAEIHDPVGPEFMAPPESVGV